MLNYFPDNTKVTANVKAFEYFTGSHPYEMTDKLMSAADVLLPGEFLGWQIYVPKNGKARISLFGSDCADIRDLKWIAGRNIILSSCRGKFPEASSLKELYELDFDPERIRRADDADMAARVDSRKFNNLIEQLSENGAFLRVVTGQVRGNETSVRYLLALPGEPPLRMRTTFGNSIFGCEFIFRGTLDSGSTRSLWDDPLGQDVPKPNITGYFRHLPLMQPFPLNGQSEVLAVRTAGIMDNMIRQTQEMFDIISDEVLDGIRIEELDFSIRSYNCLKRASLNTLKDIVKCPALARVRNISTNCVIEIDKVLKDIFTRLRSGAA